MRLRNLILAGVTAASLIPAAASAQSYGLGWGGGQGYDGYGRHGGYERGYDERRDSDRGDDYRRDGDRRGGGELMARQERLRDWIRRGTEEGWLNSWRARRAWEEFRTIREDSRRLTYGNAGTYPPGAWRDLERRIDRLTEFLRDARRGGDYRR